MSRARWDDWRGLRRVFRLPWTSARMRREIDAELQFHLEGRIEELMEREHLSRADAEAEARRRFGDLHEYRRQTRDIDQHMHRRRNRMEIIDSIRREGRQALRSLRRAPSFSFIAFATLALGIGASTAIFTMLDRVVLRPLPYTNGTQLVHIGTLWPKIKADAEFSISRAQFLYFQKNSRTLADIGLWVRDALSMPGDGGAHPAERVRAVYSSASLLNVLSVRPVAGRLFTAEEQLPGRTGVVLLSHDYWMSRYGGDRRVIGQRFVSGSSSMQIIGILPAGARLPDFKPDVWMPIRLDPSARAQNNHTWNAIGLAKSGMTPAMVDAEMKQMQAQFAALWPDVYTASFVERTGFLIRATSLHDHIVGSTLVRALWIIFASVGLVLLIAAANVANLFLVRLDARRREIAMRTALGADRAHLAVHYLTESLLLTGAAAVGAVALAYALLHVVVASAPPFLPRVEEVHLSARSIAFCMVISVATGLVFGILPLASAGLDIATLREGSRGMTSSRVRNAARRGLVVSQVALGVVLLAAAGLMLKSFAHLRGVRPGFDPSRVVTMDFILPSSRYQKFEQVSAFWHELSRRVEALPGVQSTGATTTIPLTGGNGCSLVVTDGGRNTTETSACVSTILAAPGYFATMGIRVTGQLPDWSGTESGAGPVVVSRAYADRFWPGENPIGHGVKINHDTLSFFRVVGVADDIRDDGLDKPFIPTVYFPIIPVQGGMLWSPPNYMSLVVRAADSNSPQVVASIRRMLVQMDPQVPLTSVESMEDIVSKSMAQTSFTMMLLLISAGIAVTLSAVGIYGVISYIVSQRRSEIGIRMALGAREVQVGRMVVLQSVSLAAFGATIGALAALGGMRLLRSLLFEVSPNDPAILVGVPFVLLAVAAVASFAPAWRAARVDPANALRSS
jgi:putative ABC transport system permease protein